MLDLDCFLIKFDFILIIFHTTHSFTYSLKFLYSITKGYLLSIVFFLNSCTKYLTPFEHSWKNCHHSNSRERRLMKFKWRFIFSSIFHIFHQTSYTKLLTINFHNNCEFFLPLIPINPNIRLLTIPKLNYRFLRYLEIYKLSVNLNCGI